jgi:hypothetical protein
MAIWRCNPSICRSFSAPSDGVGSVRGSPRLPGRGADAPSCDLRAPAHIAEAVATWRDEGVDEVIFADRAMREPNRRRNVYDALAEALAPLA